MTPVQFPCNPRKFGVEQFGSVSIFGFNAPEWMISAFGAMYCGAKYVGIYSTDTPDQACLFFYDVGICPCLSTYRSTEFTWTCMG